ncbi:glutamate-rich WD repeat-containing protein [Crepidotus variabilis]|uniref:Glutamate-rich WD repeat-containing protein n=1 Tax=Crepidotus variabilis TaxID=179855 RepID=A0A9P6EFD7_9AGAR|nr:glutamate-rich WD repeat-containing protein [Crepidotus variabilis]
MPKRPANETLTEVQPYNKAPASSSKRDAPKPDEMGEFEDAWEDELESDEETPELKEENDQEGMDVDEILPAIEENEEATPNTEAFIPGVHSLGKDEILRPDESAYVMLHQMGVDWPCLSFDVLRDNLGDERSRLPETSYIVAGTQADGAKNNKLVVYKMSSLHRTSKDGNESDSGDEDDENADDLDEDALLESRSVTHFGGVNRVRAQPTTSFPSTSQPYHVASWAETGKVHIWDIRQLIESLDVPGHTYDKTKFNSPVFTIDSHGRAEGFAMDWAASGSSSLRLLTGDINSKIYLTTSTPSGFNALAQPFTTHTSSVEDLQWSPSEPTVFASCSADRSIQIWDVRTKGRRSVAGIMEAHQSDVNVISWNRLTSYLLISGGDEGGIKAWDLRNVKKMGSMDTEPTPVASFTWHKAPVTSIEWHPTEDSIFAASGADDQVTLWDLAVEHDDEEAIMNETPDGQGDVPPQLLFVHQGQKDIKEVHWHPQIPGTVITTALDGFNVFKTISV